ncbi:Cullin 2 [Echinococcus multilocularis]|uniref:Cullin 2 n=1 Tax=Echinococcus multilocularis TaxID=6211 RepID=A0A068YBE4_ECHMU|nr:Cullin 2 [Echinococcus multilocularis]
MTLRAVPVDFSSKWTELGDVCFKLIRCEYVPNTIWYKSFSDVYALCVSRPDPQSPRLYEAVTDLLKDRLSEILNEISGVEVASLLTIYNHHWNVFRRGLQDLDNLFKFFNGQYVRPKRPSEADMCYSEALPTAEKHNMEILQLGLSLWKSCLIDSISCRLTACLLAEVSNDRLGIVSHQDGIVPCLESFLRVDELKGLTKVALNVYSNLFECPLVEESRICYSNWAAKAIASMSCTDYISEALKFLNEETSRATKYYIYSRDHLISLFHEIVVHQHLEFLNSNVAAFVQTENKEVLRKSYLLLAPTNQCAELIKYFGLHVKDKVNAVLARIPSDRALAPSYFVDNLLLTRDHFTKLIDEVFDGTCTYRNEMDRAFEQAINSATPPMSQASAASSTSVFSSRNTVRVAQYICRYMDDLLRRTDKRYSDADLEDKISASIALFKYIEEKDVFKQYYQRSLCFRLLFNPSTLLELEESTITKLNTVCGYEFTSKFHRMYADIQLAEGMNNNFRTYLREKSLSFPFSHYCHVLTVSAWPINTKSSTVFTPPQELSEFLRHFEAFYSTSYTGRNLRWVLSSCTAEVRLLYADRPYSLVMTALHAATMMLFESRDVDQMTLSALRTGLLGDAGAAAVAAAEAEGHETEMPPEDIMKKAVAPLIEAGLLRLLSPDGLNPTTVFEDDAIVALNRGFTSRHTKLKFLYSPQTLLNTATEEVEQVEKEVEEDRRFFTQAAIVRIMKGLKTCQHTDLIKGVIALSKGRFQPHISLIKRCIETLIEKGYLERNPNDPDQYNYMA